MVDWARFILEEAGDTPLLKMGGKNGRKTDGENGRKTDGEMEIEMKRALAAGIAMMALFACGATVSDVSARQRDQCNGLVDIDYTLGGETSYRKTGKATLLFTKPIVEDSPRPNRRARPSEALPNANRFAHGMVGRPWAVRLCERT